MLVDAYCESSHLEHRQAERHCVSRFLQTHSKAVCYCVHGPGGRASREERQAAVERAKLLAQLVEAPKKLWTSDEDVLIPVRAQIHYIHPRTCDNQDSNPVHFAAGLSGRQRVCVSCSAHLRAQSWRASRVTWRRRDDARFAGLEFLCGAILPFLKEDNTRACQ